MRKSTSNSSLVAQLTNEVQNGVSIAHTYDSLNRPTGYTIMQNAECRMQNAECRMMAAQSLQPFNLSTLQPSLTPTILSAASAGLVSTQSGPPARCAGAFM